jgi:hypothetical protein
MHFVGYLNEDYHDARSLEHKVEHSYFILCSHGLNLRSISDYIE